MMRFRGITRATVYAKGPMMRRALSTRSAVVISSGRRFASTSWYDVRASHVERLHSSRTYTCTLYPGHSAATLAAPRRAPFLFHAPHLSPVVQFIAILTVHRFDARDSLFQADARGMHRTLDVYDVMRRIHETSWSTQLDAYAFDIRSWTHSTLSANGNLLFRVESTYITVQLCSHDAQNPNS